MATVLFWEKPGCINNTRQKNLLRQAGHRVIEYNLLTSALNAQELRRFFGKLPVTDWFNRSAPAIKNGQVIPAELSEAQALALMQHDRLLIRRPLMQVDTDYAAGFDPVQVQAWIGLTPAAVPTADYETCPQTDIKP